MKKLIIILFFVCNFVAAQNYVIENNVVITPSGSIISNDTTNLYKICGGITDSLLIISSNTTDFKTVKGFRTIDCQQHTVLTDSSIVLPANGRGHYIISFNAQMLSTEQNITIVGELFENGVKNTKNISFRQNNGNGIQAATLRTVSFSSACHELQGGTVLMVKTRTLSGTTDITFSFIQFSITRIN